MRFSAPVIVLATLFAGSALAACPAGSYYKKVDGNWECTICPAGQYNRQYSFILQQHPFDSLT